MPAETDSSRVEWALRERVKELTCLYGIARAERTPGLSLEELLQRIVDLLPPAWQHPEVATARIRLDGLEVVSHGFAEGPFRQAAEILFLGGRRGAVEVFYVEPRPDSDEGPFLAEERSLIDDVAWQVGLIRQRRLSAEERSRMEEQLRSADRLASVGRLAAGVAHELNEPLAAILGYAELIGQNFGLPDATSRDLGQIVSATLRAREIVRKLLVFARRVPPERRPVKLEPIIRDALLLLRARCERAGVRVALQSGPGLPEIVADAGQLQQVVLNLCANAVQSMARGGTLRVSTVPAGGGVLLTVEDDGEGMTEEVCRQIFTPFFTTKGVGQGTGLGLSVVHGIVTGHGGTIRVESEPGRGTRFEVLLPPEPPEGPPAGEPLPDET
ncbi:MAG: PAS domain-containing sensor histidine kinase [Candidatus Eisenbacteria bacterium]|nr:PAS domain-containing sensor histidine kinase [Candidatus Eisenbacteria bacterium]